MHKLDVLLAERRDDFTSYLSATHGFIVQSCENDTATAKGVVPYRGAAGQDCSVHINVLLTKQFPFEKPSVYLDHGQDYSASLHVMYGQLLCLYDDVEGWDIATTPSDLYNRIVEALSRGASNDWRDVDLQPDLNRYFKGNGLMVTGDDWLPPKDAKHGRFSAYVSDDSLNAYACRPTKPLVLIAPNPTTDVVYKQLSYAATTQRPGIWFRLQRAPLPKSNLKDFLDEIDRSIDETPGFAADTMRSYFGDKGAASTGVIALGLERYGDEEWYFFRIGDSGKRAHWHSPQVLSAIEVSAFETAPASRDAMLRRSGNTQGLASATACVFGIGAIGSTIALQLAKAGIGYLRFIDRDKVRPTNAVRHVVGINASGYPKTDAVRFESMAHNPYCEIATFEPTFDVATLNNIIKGSAVVIDATANRPFSILLCDLARRSRIPYVEVASYRNGAIGRIRLTRAGIDACQLCYEKGYAIDDRSYPRIEGAIDSFREVGCASPVATALACDLDIVANITVQLCIDVMMDRQEEFNHYMLRNRADESGCNRGLFASRWLPRLGCALCGV